jgi:hypothetical protein
MAYKDSENWQAEVGMPLACCKHEPAFYGGLFFGKTPKVPIQ